MSGTSADAQIDLERKGKESALQGVSTQDKDNEEKGLGRNREASWVYSLKT